MKHLSELHEQRRVREEASVNEQPAIFEQCSHDFVAEHASHLKVAKRLFGGGSAHDFDSQSHPT